MASLTQFGREETISQPMHENTLDFTTKKPESDIQLEECFKRSVKNKLKYRRTKNAPWSRWAVEAGRSSVRPRGGPAEAASPGATPERAPATPLDTSGASAAVLSDGKCADLPKV